MKLRPYLLTAVWILLPGGVPAHATALVDPCIQYSAGEAPPFHDCADPRGVLTAINPAQLVPAKVTRSGLYLNAAEAHEHMTEHGAQSLFVDIRTRSEASFLGMPTEVDALIPFMEVTAFQTWDEKRSELQLEPNPAFVDQLAARLNEKGLDRDAPILLICRSGTRSAKAADLLAAAGFTRVYSVIDGYEGDLARNGPLAGQRVVNGWKNAHLPWSYQVPRNKLTAQ